MLPCSLCKNGSRIRSPIDSVERGLIKAVVLQTTSALHRAVRRMKDRERVIVVDENEDVMKDFERDHVS